jgi:hypothetical protein
MPLWFVNHQIAGNIVPVVLAQSKKSADQSLAPVFSEKKFLTDREKRVSRQEAGEDLPVGEVTVTNGKGQTPEQRTERLKDRHDEMRELHAQILQRTLEEIQTASIPLTAIEAHNFIIRDGERDWNLSTVRAALRELVEDGKVVERKETREEALVRGGGQLPKATRPMLHWPAPGPVPVRDRLPDGIKPLRSAKDHSTHATEILMSDRDKVMDALKVRSINSPRTAHQIASATGLPLDRTKSALKSLEADDLVYQNHSSWFPSFVRQNPRGTTPEKSVLPPAPSVDNVVPTAPKPPVPVSGDTDSEGNLAVVMDLAKRLGVELPTGDSEKVSELEAENARLAETVSTQSAEVDRLRKQVTALRAAIATME